MRVSVSDTPAPVAGDGRGPAGGYAYGETEDYLVPGAANPSPATRFVRGIADAWRPLLEPLALIAGAR